MSNLVMLRSKFPEISCYRSLPANASIHLILGTRILEFISLYYFCQPNPHFKKLESALNRAIQSVICAFPDLTTSAKVLNDIVTTITKKANSVKQSLEWVSGYAASQWSNKISVIFEGILWITSESLKQREFEFSMLDKVLEAYSTIFEIKIILFSNDDERKDFCSIKPGTYPVMYVLSKGCTIHMAYGNEIILIQDDNTTDLSSVLLNPQMIYEVKAFIAGKIAYNITENSNIATKSAREEVYPFARTPYKYSMQTPNNSSRVNIRQEKNSLVPVRTQNSSLNRIPTKFGVKPSDDYIPHSQSKYLRDNSSVILPDIRNPASRNPIQSSINFSIKPQLKLKETPRFILEIERKTHTSHAQSNVDSYKHTTDGPELVINHYSPSGTAMNDSSGDNFRPSQPNLSLPHPSDSFPPPIRKNENTAFPSIDEERKGNSLVSKRTDISMLKLESTITEEIRCNYSHCIGICRSYNPITAFGEALQQFFCLKSNKEIKNKVRHCFKDKKTFSNLILDKSYRFSKTRPQVLRSSLLDISKIALEKAEEIDEEAKYYKELQLAAGNDMMFAEIRDGPHPDYFLLTLLCKIFGFTGVITGQTHYNSKIFEKTQVNGCVLGFRPELHFIALKTEDEKNHLHVLLTNSHVLEDKFSIEEQKAAKERTVPHIIPNRELQQQTRPSKANENAHVEFLIELSKLQNQVLESMRTCVEGRTPIMINTSDIDSKRDRVKTLARDFDYQQLQEKYAFIQPNILNIKAINYCQSCEFCKNKDYPPDVFCDIGCYYHGECLSSVFLEWFSQSSKKPIAEQSFPCPTCRKSIRLATFLVSTSDAQFLNMCLQDFENKYICGSCKAVRSLGEVTIHNYYCRSHVCPECQAIMVLRNEKSYLCSNGDLIPLPDAQNALYRCFYCRKETLICNFIDYRDEMLGGIACKRCWIDWYYKKNVMTNNMPEATLRYIFDLEAIACAACNNAVGHRPYTDLACKSGCVVCYGHLTDNSCKNCGEPNVDIGNRIW